MTPDILEVQIKAQKNVSLISNLRIRITSVIWMAFSLGKSFTGNKYHPLKGHRTADLQRNTCAVYPFITIYDQ